MPDHRIGSLPRTVDPFERARVIGVSTLGDDFANLVNEMRQARVTPEGHVVEELDGMAEQREAERRREDAQVPRVLITPPSARKGVLGGSANMKNGAPAQRLIHWFADRLDEAIPLSICVAPITSDVNGNFSTASATSSSNAISGAGAQNRPYANIYWMGGRGVPMQAQVDVRKGVQFTVHGTFVAVDVGLDAGNANGSMDIGAWLSFYSISRPSLMTRTIFIDALANAGTQTVVIPSFAVSLLPLQSSTTTANIQMNFRDKNGTLIQRSDLLAPGTQRSPIPLPDDAYDVVFTNNDTVAVTARAMFELCF
jgi:hypothetical protein